MNSIRSIRETVRRFAVGALLLFAPIAYADDDAARHYQAGQRFEQNGERLKAIQEYAIAAGMGHAEARDARQRLIEAMRTGPTPKVAAPAPPPVEAVQPAVKTTRPQSAALPVAKDDDSIRICKLIWSGARIGVDEATTERCRAERDRREESLTDDTPDSVAGTGFGSSDVPDRCTAIERKLEDTLMAEGLSARDRTNIRNKYLADEGCL